MPIPAEQSRRSRLLIVLVARGMLRGMLASPLGKARGKSWTMTILLGVILLGPLLSPHRSSAQPPAPQAVEVQSIRDVVATTDRASGPEVELLKIGSRAPELDVESWIHVGQGFTEITEFERGKVYVLEFWASWCKPCVSAMPHTAKVQAKFRDQDVQVITLTDEPVSTVTEFLSRDVDEDDLAEFDLPQQTYGQLIAEHSLATDTDESTYRDYLEAAQRTGIPCTFVVGKQGVIEWIGHPMNVDEPLEKVLIGTWNRDRFAAKYEEEQGVNRLLADVSSLMRAEEVDEALDRLDGFLRKDPTQKQRDRLTPIKLQILASSGAHHDQTVVYALQLIGDPTHTPSSANDLAWRIYLMAENGHFEDEKVSREALDLASKHAVNGGHLTAFILDTVAHLQHITGDHRLALETQRRACELVAEDEKADLQSFLQQLETLVNSASSVSRSTGSDTQ